MDNNFNKSNLDNILSSQNSKINREAIERAKKSGNTDELIKNLSAEDKQKLNAVLNDKKALENILKSPQAAAILKMFGGGKNG